MADTGTSVLLIILAFIAVILGIKLIKGIIRMFLILGVLILALWYFTRLF